MVFEPDRSRIVLFDPAAKGRLVAMQASVPKLVSCRRCQTQRHIMESCTCFLITHLLG